MSAIIKSQLASYLRAKSLSLQVTSTFLIFLQDARLRSITNYPHHMNLVIQHQSPRPEQFKKWRFKCPLLCSQHYSCSLKGMHADGRRPGCEVV